MNNQRTIDQAIAFINDFQYLQVVADTCTARCRHYFYERDLPSKLRGLASGSLDGCLVEVLKACYRVAEEHGFVGFGDGKDMVASNPMFKEVIAANSTSVRDPWTYREERIDGVRFWYYDVERWQEIILKKLLKVNEIKARIIRHGGTPALLIILPLDIKIEQDRELELKDACQKRGIRLIVRDLPDLGLIDKFRLIDLWSMEPNQ